MPSADRAYPRNTMLHWKKWHFFVLIFKLKSLNLWNTISIWSNISSKLTAKMQISSRYSSKVTNCWSPKHISIRWQKLNPEFDKPKGILVNLYSPDLAWNAVHECLPLLLAFADRLVWSQKMKTSHSYAHLIMPCQFLVKGKHSLPQLNSVSGNQCKVIFTGCLAYNHHLGSIWAFS